MYECKRCGEITDRLYFLIYKQSEKMCEKCAREKFEIINKENLWNHGFVYLEGEKNKRAERARLN